MVVVACFGLVVVPVEALASATDRTVVENGGVIVWPTASGIELESGDVGPVAEVLVADVAVVANAGAMGAGVAAAVATVVGIEIVEIGLNEAAVVVDVGAVVDGPLVVVGGAGCCCCWADAGKALV